MYRYANNSCQCQWCRAESSDCVEVANAITDLSNIWVCPDCLEEVLKEIPEARIVKSAVIYDPLLSKAVDEKLYYKVLELKSEIETITGHWWDGDIEYLVKHGYIHLSPDEIQAVEDEMSRMNDREWEQEFGWTKEY